MHVHIVPKLALVIPLQDSALYFHSEVDPLIQTNLLKKVLKLT